MEQFVSFAAGGKTLRGVLHLPETGAAVCPAIVFCHGFKGNKIGLHRIFVKAARFFCQAGYAVLRFDFSGSGESDGVHEEITVDGQVAEVQAAIELLRRPVTFMEHCWLFTVPEIRKFRTKTQGGIKRPEKI